MRRQSSGRNAHHYFMLSGFPSDRKVQLCTKIRSLGGIYNETDHFEVKCTHIVCKKPSKSEKFLAGCATGKWLVTQQYIDDSYNHGRWLAEAPYEWGPRWREGLDPVSRQFLGAPGKWRTKVQKTGQGVFVGWRVTILVDHPIKYPVYTRLLELGGATVLSPCVGSPSKTLRKLKHLPDHLIGQAESLTHVFVEGRAEALIDPLIEKGVFCLKPVYIGDFLLLDKCPSPEDYLVSNEPRLEHKPVVVKIEPQCKLESGENKTAIDHRKVHSNQSKVLVDPGKKVFCINCRGEIAVANKKATSREVQRQCKCVILNRETVNGRSVATFNFYSNDPAMNRGKSKLKEEPYYMADTGIDMKCGIKGRENCGENIGLTVKRIKTEPGVSAVKWRRGRKRLSDENHPVERRVRKCAEMGDVRKADSTAVRCHGSVEVHKEKIRQVMQGKIALAEQMSDVSARRHGNVSPIPSPCKAEPLGLTRTPVKTRSSGNIRNKKGSKDSPALQRLTQSCMTSFVTRAKSEPSSPISSGHRTPVQSPWKLSLDAPRIPCNLSQNNTKVVSTLTQHSDKTLRGKSRKKALQNGMDNTVNTVNVNSGQNQGKRCCMASQVVMGKNEVATPGDKPASHTESERNVSNMQTRNRRKSEAKHCIENRLVLSPVKITYKEGYQKSSRKGQAHGTDHLTMENVPTPKLKRIVLKLTRMSHDDNALCSSQGSNSESSENVSPSQSPSGKGCIVSRAGSSNQSTPGKGSIINTTGSSSPSFSGKGSVLKTGIRSSQCSSVKGSIINITDSSSQFLDRGTCIISSQSSPGKGSTVHAAGSSSQPSSGNGYVVNRTGLSVLKTGIRSSQSSSGKGPSVKTVGSSSQSPDKRLLLKDTERSCQNLGNGSIIKTAGRSSQSSGKVSLVKSAVSHSPDRGSRDTSEMRASQTFDAGSSVNLVDGSSMSPVIKRVSSGKFLNKVPSVKKKDSLSLSQVSDKGSLVEIADSLSQSSNSEWSGGKTLSSTQSSDTSNSQKSTSSGQSSVGSVSGSTRRKSTRLSKQATVASPDDLNLPDLPGGLEGNASCEQGDGLEAGGVPVESVGMRGTTKNEGKTRKKGVPAGVDESREIESVCGVQVEQEGEKRGGEVKPGCEAGDRASETPHIHGGLYRMDSKNNSQSATASLKNANIAQMTSMLGQDQSLTGIVKSKPDACSRDWSGGNSQTTKFLWPEGGSNGEGTDRRKSIKSLTEDEVVLYAAALVRKNKILNHRYGLSMRDVTASSYRLETQSSSPRAFGLSENYTALFEVCLEEGLYTGALEMLSSSLSTVRYPLSRTLRTVIRDILLAGDCAVHQEKAFVFLQKVLTQHPPHTPAMQAVYLSALSDPKEAHSGPWQIVQHIIRTSLTRAREGLKHFCALRFLLMLFERDFQLYQQRMYTAPWGTTHKVACLWGQVLWPSGILALGQLNTACQELLGLFVEAFSLPDTTVRIELVSHLQLLVAMTAECCRLSYPSSPLVYNLASEKLQLFSRELVRRARMGLDWTRTGPDVGLELLLGGMRLPWLACVVCEHLLEYYDESLLPLVAVVEDRTVTLKKIVSQYFYLLPPLTELTSLHRKTKQSAKEDSQNSGRRGSTPRKSDSQSQSISSGPSSTKSSVTPTKSSVTPTKYTVTPTKYTVTPTKLTPSKRGATPSKKKPDGVNKRNAKGETALHRACITNNLPKIKELLQTPGIDVNQADYAGWTPLHECCNYGHVEAVSALLHYRPAATITTFFSKDGEEKRRVDLLACNEEGITPLHDAVTNNHLEVVRLLLEHGGRKLLEGQTGSGQTAVDMATSTEMLHLLQQTTFRSPIKRKYLQSSEFSLSQSYLSQTMTQNCDFSEETYQPVREVYTDILAMSSSCSSSSAVPRYITNGDLKQYVLTVFYLLKNYVDMQDLIEISTYCRQYNDGMIDLESLVGENDLTNVRVTGYRGDKRADRNVQGKMNNTWETTSNDGLILERGRRKRQSKREVVRDGGGEINERTKGKQDKPAVSDYYRKTLIEDLGVYMELKYHIRGFKSHLKMISQKRDSKEAFDCQLRLLLLAMRAIHVE